MIINKYIYVYLPQKKFWKLWWNEKQKMVNPRHWTFWSAPLNLELDNTRLEATPTIFLKSGDTWWSQAGSGAVFQETSLPTSLGQISW